MEKLMLISTLFILILQINGKAINNDNFGIILINLKNCPQYFLYYHKDLFYQVLPV